jgi:hypothetical protein
MRNTAIAIYDVLCRSNLEEYKDMATIETDFNFTGSVSRYLSVHDVITGDILNWNFDIGAMEKCRFGDSIYLQTIGMSAIFSAKYNWIVFTGAYLR